MTVATARKRAPQAQLVCPGCGSGRLMSYRVELHRGPEGTRLARKRKCDRCGVRAMTVELVIFSTTASQISARVNDFIPQEGARI